MCRRSRTVIAGRRDVDKDAWWPEVGQTYRDAAGRGIVLLVLMSPCLPGVLRCDGAAMIAARPLPCSYHSRTAITASLRPGWRFSDPFSGMTVRCLRGGHGHLSYGGRALTADMAAR
jgi:hypothetical protein